MAPVGSSRLLRFQTFGTDGLPRNADEVRLTVTHPDGTTDALTVSPASGDNGDYSQLVTMDAAGFWSWLWEVVTAGDAAPRAIADGVLIGTGRDAPQNPWCDVSAVILTPAVKKLADKNELDLEVVARQTMAATEWLHSRTWRRFRGLKVVELRPCCSCIAVPITARLAGRFWPMLPTLDVAPIIDRPAPCGCSFLHAVELPADTQHVDRVTIDGAEFNAWRLDGRQLLRTDDEPWPCCQSIDKPSDQENTFAVRVVVGGELYEIARSACAELAAEFTLAISDPASCRIPVRVTNVVRQGATYQKAETTGVTKDGGVGLRLVDIFLAEFGKPRKRAAIASPDVPPVAHRIG